MSIVLIQTQTATSQTALPFTTGITPIYNNYLIMGNNITTPSFAGSFFGLQISTDGGTTFFDGGYSTEYAYFPVIGIFPGDTTLNASFNVILQNFTSGVGNIQVAGTAAVYDSSVPGNYAFNTGGGYMPANVVGNAFQLAADDGSAFSGTFSLYGYLF
jgi:hypothetical protein